MNSRTSRAQRQAAAILAAHSSASSREGTSTTENPPTYALLSGDGPAATVPSVATTLISSWGYSPPPSTHTPASMASWPTACAASARSGRSSSGNVIAPSSNEIRYLGMYDSLVWHLRPMKCYSGDDAAGLATIG